MTTTEFVATKKQEEIKQKNKKAREQAKELAHQAKELARQTRIREENKRRLDDYEERKKKLKARLKKLEKKARRDQRKHDSRLPGYVEIATFPTRSYYDELKNATPDPYVDSLFTEERINLGPSPPPNADGIPADPPIILPKWSS